MISLALVLTALIFVIGILAAFYFGATLARGKDPLERVRTRMRPPEITQNTESVETDEAIAHLSPPDIFARRKAKEDFELLQEKLRNEAL